MRTLERQGMSYRAIARELNRLAIKTGRGCQWYGVTVKAALQQHRSANHEKAAWRPYACGRAFAWSSTPGCEHVGGR